MLLRLKHLPNLKNPIPNAALVMPVYELIYFPLSDNFQYQYFVTSTTVL